MSRRVDIYQRIMNLVGDRRWGESGAIPEARSVRYQMRRNRPVEVDPQRERDYSTFGSNNDGAELWFGTRDRWHHHMSHREVRMLWWWLTVEWFGRARWLGLRRPIYYWALRRKVDGWQRRVAAARVAESSSSGSAP